MDEIDFIKKIKRTFKYINIFFFGYVIIWLVIIFIQCIIRQNINISGLGNWIGLMSIIAISINVFYILIYSIIFLIYKLNYMKIDINSNKEYIRELYKYYPPAIVSLIYDLKTEVYRDYTATILYLYTKKYFDILHFNEEVEIKKGTNENLWKLDRHELYVYNCIIYKQTFNQKTFEELIFEDSKQKQLIIEEEDENKKKLKIIFIEVSILIILIKLIGISDNEIWTLLMTIILSTVIVGFIMFPIILENMQKKLNNYKLTQKGKEELKKIKAFKNFIKEYTLIEEKDIKYIQILEEYISYSLSLGTSPQVEEYIKQNEIYRNLIYKGRENLE